MEVINVTYKITAETAMKLHEIQEAIDPAGEDDEQLFQFLISCAEDFAYSDEVEAAMKETSNISKSPILTVKTVQVEEKPKPKTDEEILDEMYREKHSEFFREDDKDDKVQDIE